MADDRTLTIRANFETRDDALLAGDVVVSVDIAAGQLPKVNRIFGDPGAMHVSSH